MASQDRCLDAATVHRDPYDLVPLSRGVVVKFYCLCGGPLSSNEHPKNVSVQSNADEEIYVVSVIERLEIRDFNVTNFLVDDDGKQHSHFPKVDIYECRNCRTLIAVE